MKKIFIFVFSFFAFLVFNKAVWAMGASQLSISTPTHGASYGSTSDVSTSVSWSNMQDATTVSGYYLDRRLVAHGDILDPPSIDTCYFNPVRITTNSGSQTGTLKDGAGVVSSTQSSSNCFPYAGGEYKFVATIVYCESGTYNGVSNCMLSQGRIISRTSRYFLHAR